VHQLFTINKIYWVLLKHAVGNDDKITDSVSVLQHSMVYFFHHYELPAILQQARVQQLLNRNGTGNVPGMGVPHTPANHVPPTNAGTAGTETQAGTTPQPANLPNGHIDIDTHAGDQQQHILHNHIDQGLLNEIFEGVDDVQVDGFNIDQQLLMNLEEEIQEIQNTHSEAVANSGYHPDSNVDEPVEQNNGVVIPTAESNISANTGVSHECASVSDTNNHPVTCEAKSETLKHSGDLAKSPEHASIASTSAIGENSSSGCVRYRGHSDNTDSEKNADGTEV